MALMQLGVKARSYTGWQVKVLTDSAFTKARIVSIDEDSIRKDLGSGVVVVVAGFQGVDEEGNITTLGRGGSDTSAVALAAALKADECQIYTDVDGVYTSDPRLVPAARRLQSVTFEEMLEMAGAGSKVLQIRSVEFAGKYKVPTRVLSSLTDLALPLAEEARSGTLITFEEDPHMAMEKAVISGVAFNRDEAKITVHDVPDRPGVAYAILGPIADANIDVDVIVQNVGHDGMTDMTFTVHRNDYSKAVKILQDQGQAAHQVPRGVGRRAHRQGVDRRHGHALARRHRGAHVPHARRGGHQHPDDLDLGDQDHRGDRGEIHRARRPRPAQGV